MRLYALLLMHVAEKGHSQKEEVMKSQSRKMLVRFSVLIVFMLVVSGSLMFIFGGNSNSLEDRLASMNVTTVSTVVRGARTITAGNALVITGGGRVEGNITVMPGALLVVEGNTSTLSGNGDRAVQGRVILRGGDFYLVSGGIWNSTAGFTLAALVVVDNGSNFTMLDGVLRSGQTSGNSGTFGVDVINGNFTMKGGEILTTALAPAAPAVRLNANGNGNFSMYGGVLRLPSIPNGTVAVSINGGTFNMRGGAISRPSNANTADVGVRVNGGGNNPARFVMYDGEIYNCNTGVEVSGTNGAFIMNGGTIRDNRSGSGAGVDLSARANFTMHGGVITNNRVTASGGGGAGVLVSNSTFTMHGGSVNSNHAQSTSGINNRGGGVGVVGGGRFYMYGGYIEDNVAGAGGGVHVMSSSSLSLGGAVNHNSYMRLDGGTIRNNESIYANSEHGGGGIGVFASAIPVGNSVATVNMYSGYITGNRASSRGGAAAFGASGGGVMITTGGSTAAANPGVVFNMHGGVISNNVALCDKTNNIAADMHNMNVMGGGVMISRNGSTFNMLGGTIEGNESVAGGGVALSNSATFNMDGGTIRANEAFGGYARQNHSYLVDRGMELRGGGGVYIHHTSAVISTNISPVFNMNAGSIVENISPCGGGIFWMCSVNRGSHDGINSPFGNVDFRSDQIRELALTRVYISAQAVVQNNIALNGSRVDDELWGRHRAESPIVNWGGHVVTRTVPAPSNCSFNEFGHLFNNHDIRTRQGVTGDIIDPQDEEYTVTFVAGIQGMLNGGAVGVDVPVDIYYGDTVGLNRVPSVTAIHGWEFVGWSYDYYGYHPADPANHVVLDDISFYAQYQRVYFRVTFVAGENGVSLVTSISMYCSKIC